MSTHPLITRGNKLFEEKKAADTLWQSIALNFYPERAHFTVTHNEGDEFADHLLTSYPVMVRRDLANQLGGMLRRGKWFEVTLDGEDPKEHRARAWLQWASDVQRKTMYKRESMFTRAVKEGDQDFVTFGQCAISVEWVPGRGLLYRAWHLRDMAWAENAFGETDEFHRKWKPTLNELVKRFGKERMNPKALKTFAKNPFHKLECRHVVIPAEDYSGEKQFKTPFVSVFIDVEHEHTIEEIGVYHPMYVIPRWQTASGSAYAHSPATIVGIADARLIQDMHRVLMDAGEMAVRPPMIGSREGIRGDVSLYAGGLTWVDASFEEKPREALVPMATDKSGIPIGMEMLGQAQAMLSEVFYLNKLTLPMTQDMTAFEASQRVQEYIRTALPIFEPMEAEYNGQVCDMTFDVLMRAGQFGLANEFPPSLRGTEVDFRFKSPIRDAEGTERGTKFQEAMNMIMQGAQVDPGAAVSLDMNTALREAMRGVGVPEEWLPDPKQVEQAQKQMAEMAIQGSQEAAA